MAYLKPEEKKLFETMQDDPVWFCREILGIKDVWSKQEEILLSVKNNKKTAVKAGYNVGKSFIAACAAVWFLNVFKDSRVITTAPTHTQVEDVLWAEIRKIYQNSKYPLGGRVMLTEIQKAPGWYATGLSPRVDSSVQSARFQGFHAEHVLIIFDEAPGIDAHLYDGAEGLMSGSHSRWLCIGNPISSNDKFCSLFSAKGWNKITVSCLESPNVTFNKNMIPGMVTKDWVDERREEWVEDSSLWQTKVLGNFPDEGSDTLIPLEWLLSATKRKLQPHAFLKNPKTMGIDVARYGDNETVFSVFDGYQEIDKVYYKGKGLPETTGYAIELYNRHRPDLIVVDDAGVGGGLADNLQMKYPVLVVNGGSKATDERFFNLNCETWWYIRELFRKNEIAILDDSTTINQLNCRRYIFDDKGKLKIESKRDMHKRGVDSPDRADALILAVYGQSQVGKTRFLDRDDEDESGFNYKKYTNVSRTGYG